MSCFHPLTAYWATPYGSGITFVKKETIYTTNPVPIKCGRCTGCRLEYTRQWALRIKHEAELHTNNSFITLTYNDSHLPKNGTLKLEDFQKFMKRLRKALSPKKISFYHCGEYGEQGSKRPHYHAIIFNHQFTNLQSIGSKKKPLYTSQQLHNLWKQPLNKGDKPTSIGHHSIGKVTFESASYVASYVQKKLTGPRADAINMSNGLRHYERMTPQGEVITLKPEYATMSRNPGIAGNWLTQNHTDIYPSDFVTHKGKKHSLPLYYDLQYAKLTEKNPEILENIKLKRSAKMQQLAYLFTPEALKQKEVHHKAKMALYKRNTL